MIIRKRPNGFQLFFIMKGSVVPRIIWPLCITILLAVIGTFTRGTLFGVKITMTPIPFTLIGLALAIFLGFRNSVSYDRYWEGRKLWGELILMSRSVTRQILTFTSVGAGVDGREWPPFHQEDCRSRMVLRLIAFAHALRHHLRDTEPGKETLCHLPVDEVAEVQSAHNRPDYLLLCTARDLRCCLEKGEISDFFAASIDRNLSSLSGVLAGCERIKNTPIPFTYNLLLHRTAFLYCFLLPFGLVDSIGFMTPLVVGIISFTFFGLDALGDEIEDPFGLRPNNLALTAMCRTIERDLLAALGHRELPEPIRPVKYLMH